MCCIQQCASALDNEEDRWISVFRDHSKVSQLTSTQNTVRDHAGLLWNTAVSILLGLYTSTIFHLNFNYRTFFTSE